MPPTLNDGWTYDAQVGAGPPRPLIAWLAARFDHTDAAGWAARIRDGQVEVDDRVAAETSTVQLGSRVRWHRPPWIEPDAPLDFAVVDDDGDLLVVDKPAGLPTVPAGGFLVHTLLTQVQRRHPDATPMHRLGTGTSGLVLFVRSPAARAAVQAAWRRGAVDRRYVGVLTGTPTWSTHTETAPIGPVPHPTIGSVHAASAQGRPATTHLAVNDQRGDDAIVDVHIETGRPHQIRIHAAVCGHPLRGDPLYGPGGMPTGDARPTAGGYLLHAAALSLPDPRGDDLRVWSCPPRWRR